MTPEDASAVVALLAAAFGRPATPETFEVYEVALEDLDVEDPRGLVKRLLRTMERWPSPAQLRRAILDHHGLLAPTEDEAWRIASTYAAHVDHARDVGAFDLLPEAVQEAVRTVGGSWSIRVSDRGVVFAQFRDAYRLAKARIDGEALARSWNGLPLAPASQLPLRDGTDRGLGPG